MPAQDLAPGLGLRPLRVLLVEDSEDDAFLLERHLRKSGYAATVARVERREALQEALRAEPGPEVVLADYNLPHFSGPEALALVRGSGQDVPFIMMSGAVSEETAVESMRAGAQDYVAKGNLARLIPALERELKEASARRKRAAAERALRASEARFHRLVEAMPLSLLILSVSGRILYTNTAAERLLGYTAEEIASAEVTIDAVCPALRGLYGESGVPVPREPFESVCRTTAGQTVEVLIGVALLNPDEVAAEQQFAAFLADLTLQKKSEEMLRQTEKLAVAGRLAASIAHEINNPLEAVTNCMYLMATTELPADAREYLEMAEKELARVTQITVQTLRFYRRSSRASRMDVHELIEGVLTLFDSRLAAAGVKVVREFRADLLLEAHDGEIRQVLVNLVGNAIDAMTGGGVLRLRTSRGREWRGGVAGRRGLRVTVADDGTGMEPETLGRLFEPFFSTKGITGAGLGLWVSKEIMDKHEGALRVRSRRGSEGVRGGTVFSMFLPETVRSRVTEAEALTVPVGA